MKRQPFSHRSKPLCSVWFRFPVNGQSKNLWQSEGGPDIKAGADQRQVINCARKLLSGRSKFNDPTPMHGNTGIFSAITVSHYSEALAQYVIRRAGRYLFRAQRFQVSRAACMSACACTNSRHRYFAACSARLGAVSRQRGPCPCGTLGRLLRYQLRQKETWVVVPMVRQALSQFRRHSVDKLKYEV